MMPINDEYTHELVESVTPVPCYKINVIYDSSFWIEYDLKALTTASKTDVEVHGLYIEDA